MTRPTPLRPLRFLTALFIPLLTALIASPTARAQPVPSGALLVLSKSDEKLAIVDPSSFKVLARIPVGADPHEVVASADGRLAYVSNYGGGTLHTLAVIDLKERKALPAIDLGPLRGPHGLIFAGDKVWFTAEGAKVVGSYDPSSKAVDWVLGTGQNRTHMIWVAGDLKRVVTTNVSSATVSIIEKKKVENGFGRNGPPPGPPPGAPQGGPKGGPEGRSDGQRRPPGPPRGPREDWNQTVIPVGNGAEGFDVSPDGKEIWVANANDGTVSIIDFATEKVTFTLAANVPGANRLKFTPDGKRVLISSLRGADVVILDAATHADVKRLPIGHGAAGIVMQPDGARAYVACTPDNDVAVIDLKTLEIVGRIEAGKQPDGLAWVGN